MRCLQKKPSDRYADGKELHAALMQCALPPAVSA
jgi:hypothetical protein